MTSQANQLSIYMIYGTPLIGWDSNEVTNLQCNLTDAQYIITAGRADGSQCEKLCNSIYLSFIQKAYEDACAGTAHAAMSHKEP